MWARTRTGLISGNGHGRVVAYSVLRYDAPGDGDGRWPRRVFWVGNSDLTPSDAIDVRSIPPGVIAHPPPSKG